MTVIAGQTASFTATATGNPLPTAQWQVSADNGTHWADIDGAAATTYAFTAWAGDSGKQFRALFSNAAGTAATTAATLTLARATPVVSWVNPIGITYGTPLGEGQLNASSSVPGTFVFTPAAGTVLGAGLAQTLSATFTPTNSANYETVTATVLIDVDVLRPTLTNLTPSQVARSGGMFTLHVTGTGILAGATVYWDGRSQITTFNGSTDVQAMILGSDVLTARSVPVMVRNPAPNGGDSNTLTFTITEPVPPAISGVTPASGPIGSAVTLTGTGFTGAMSVTFNGVGAATNVVSDSQITATVPPGTTTGPVRVTTPGGTATSSGDFIVTNERANRTLPVCYATGYPMTVTVDVAAGPDVKAQALRENVPTGWTIGTISDGGWWDGTLNQVRWGPFVDAAARTITYELTPPVESGSVTFTGVVSFDGVEVPVGGAATLTRCEAHPADTNGDFRLVMNEVTAYGAAWKRGQSWTVPPVPIPIGYVTRAGYLWRMGETYRRYPGECPACWSAEPPAPVPDVSPSPAVGVKPGGRASR